MSLVKAKEYLQKYGLEDKIMEFSVSSATVEEAAKAINCKEEDIPFMECNHAIISMENIINGCININDETINFNDNKCYIEKDSFNITFRKNQYLLNIKSKYNKGLKLVAPIKGKMNKDVFESISTTATVTLKKGKEVIFSDTSDMCGLEIV